jgi:hypothetical protein
MREAEWRACTNPQWMLAFLRGKVSNRKLRLFACGCCRVLFSDFFIFDSGIEGAIETAEWYAEGLVGEDVRQDAEQAARTVEFGTSYDTLVNQALVATVSETLSAADVWAYLTRYSQEYAHDDYRILSPDKLALCGCRVLRDIFGPLPFRPVIVETSWATWNDGTIPKLAQAIHDDRAFDRLSILADALEEVGCSNPDILDHCRKPGDHGWGCWVIDVLLGRE